MPFFVLVLIRLPAKLGFPFVLSLLMGGGKPLWFDKLTTNGFPHFWVLQEVYCWFKIWLYLKLDQLWYKHTKWFIFFIVLFLLLVIYLIANS